MKAHKLLIIIAFLYAFTACSGSGLKPVSQHICFDQSESIPLENTDKKWLPVSIPCMFMVPYDAKNNFQYVWMKFEFQVPVNHQQYTGLSLGPLYHIDEVFINGTPVGRHGSEHYGNVHYPRNYDIPASLIRGGKNFVHIRLGIFGTEYGGILREPRIMESDSFYYQTILDNFLFNHLPTGIILFLFGQILLNIIFLYKKRTMRINTFSILLCLSLTWYIFLLFTPWWPFDYGTRITLLWSCTAFVPIIFLQLVQAFYRVQLPILNRTAVPLFILFFILIMINPDTTSSWYMGRIAGTAILFIALIFICMSIIMATRIKGTAILPVMIFFGIFPGVFIVFDILNYLFIFHNPPLTHTYSLPLFIVGIMIHIIDDSIKKEVELESLYGELRTYSRNARELVITSTTEEKLERIKTFLRENYGSEISREGLADAMEMSPDHMSRMFKAYEGKKISDFINELRIDEAREKLINSEMKIIEIAFATGFESLATFNRVFLKLTGQSPTQYRKTKKD